MIHCPQCGGESPQGSAHCVHCGQRLGEADSQKTQFGMPQINLADAPAPANPLASAPSPLSSPSPLGGGEPTPVSSLLAGLPRPRVASAPSPLTTGGSPFDEPLPLAAEREASPSARSTVMGMPVLARPSADIPAPQSVALEDTPAADAPRLAIQSMDDLDLGGPRQAAVVPAEPAAAPTPAANHEPEQAAEPDPAPRVAEPEPAPVAGVQPATPADPQAPAARRGQYTLPEEAPAEGGGGSAAVKILIAVVVLAAGGWLAWTQLG